MFRLFFRQFLFKLFLSILSASICFLPSELWLFLNIIHPTAVTLELGIQIFGTVQTLLLIIWIFALMIIWTKNSQFLINPYHT